MVTAPLSADDLEQYGVEGYCIVPMTLGDELLSRLQAAAESAVEKTRRGVWPYKRDWPHQHFKGTNDFWGVGNLLHPDLGEPSFASYLASPGPIEAACLLLGVPWDCREELLQLEFVNLLVNPTSFDFEIGWHRDNIRRDLDPPEEAADLRRPRVSVRWNYALYDDTCLLVVPGSHRRPKTPRERDVFLNRRNDPLPGQCQIRLRACQAVFYDPDLLHRGVYRSSQLRRTLHCDLGLTVDALHRAELYNSLAWMSEIDLRPTLPESLHPLYANFVRQHAEFRRHQRA